MKVSVYKLNEGGMSVLIQSTPGKGRSPVLLCGITPDNVVDQVLPVVRQMRRPKGVPLDPTSL
ncbi:unnamed protein product [marine sediment metagenome]|uniref:Uncharacterized protein n=1 Tax=marine sediment metagenome TaxID=412755 RepID=X1GLG7_9ZZZZ